MKKEKRYKEEKVLFAGLWVGDSKPDINAFLNILVKDLADMTDPFGEQIRVKARLIRLTFDLPARAGVLYQISHGGRCACPFCYIQGVYLEGNMKYCYPFVESTIAADLKLRTKDETSNIYRELLARTEAKEYFIISGLKGIPIFNLLKYWSMVETTTVDIMHHCMGISKTLIRLWSKMIPKDDGKQFDSLLTQEKLVSSFYRKVRSIITHGKYYKASESMVFLLYLSRLIKGYISNTLYEHHMKLVNSLMTLLEESIPVEKLDKIECNLYGYVNEFQVCETLFLCIILLIQFRFIMGKKTLL